jgi:hypothetical protein
MSGIAEDKVPAIAEGLNRSKQVDDPSLVNLQGHFDKIREVMKGRPGEDAISYHQGDSGDIYITEILAMLEMFNCQRFTNNKHPHYLLSRMKSALEFYKTDLKAPSPLDLLIPRLPEILRLADNIKKRTPTASKEEVGFQLGRVKLGKKVRAASAVHKNEPLPFIGSSIDCRVPNGWLFPMLAAFRANVRWDLEKGIFAWKLPLDELLDTVIGDLVRVCVSEHKTNNLRPDQVGKRESTYAQCYDKVRLALLEEETR